MTRIRDYRFFVSCYPLQKQYYNHINLLRGIAALMVCVFHFAKLDTGHGLLFSTGSAVRLVTDFGYTGVFIFFVLSGFVIPISLQNSQFKINKLHRFLARRYVRIEIPYVFSILLVLLVGFIFSVANHTQFEFDIGRFISHLFYTVSFTHHEWYNDIYWTLAIEIQFYILMALSFFVLNKSTWGAIGLLIGLMTVSCFFWDARFVTHYMPCFAAGIGCWLFKQKKIDWRLFVLLLIACFCTTWYLFRYYDALIILFAVGFILFVPEMKNQKFTIGKISYSLYLTHGVIGGNVIYFLVNRVSSIGGSFLIFAGAIMVSVVFAYLFYLVIERPSIHLSKKIKIDPSKNEKARIAKPDPFYVNNT